MVLNVDFSRLLGHRGNRTEEEAQADGAKVFLRKFGGFFGKDRREESRTLELIINLGLASTEQDARAYLERLEGRHINYSDSSYFTLRKVSTIEGEREYELHRGCSSVL